MKITTSETQQQQAVLHVSDTLKQYQDLLQPYHQRLLAVYKELNTFTYPKNNDWSTTFKVNKMHEVSNKITPRIISRDPKWIVSIKPDLIEKVQKDIWELNMQANAIQDLLNAVFKKQYLSEPLRLRAKAMVNYWPAFAKVATKYEIARKENKVDKEEPYIDENGVEQVRKIDKEIEEKVVDQYTTIETVSWTDMFYDPRYQLFRDMPAVIQVKSGVRLGELKKTKKYFNLDKLDDIVRSKNTSNFKEQVQNITGLTLTAVPEIDKNNLTVAEYYGLYDLKDNWDERLYKICVVNGLICIDMEEITQIPFEQIRCFEDTETNLSVWFLEPIFWLQQELNYKKNSASEYINHALNRSYIWSPNSWINPKRLISKPNNIIPTSKSVEEAMRNLQEVPHRQLDPSYFQEQNDFERQIQGLTFTIDTNNSQNQQGLTNTATGMRIKFYESNAVIDDVRKHYEQWLERLAYKLLQEIAENSEENITIKKIWDDSFWEINKEAMMDSLEKYEINIEAWSSSYDTIEERRNDAIAKWEIALKYRQAGVPIKLDEMFKDTMNTFESVNPEKYIEIQQTIPGIWWGMAWGLWIPEKPLNTPEALTESVAKGAITTGL